MSRNPILFAFAALLWLGSCRTIKPALPVFQANGVPTVPLPPSKIDIPISVDLSKTLAQLNDSIPASLFSDNWPLMQGSGDCQVEYRWRFKRAPLEIGLSGSNINIFSTGYYGTEARVRPCCAGICPWIGVSCGNDNVKNQASPPVKKTTDTLEKAPTRGGKILNIDSTKANGLPADTITPTAQIKLGLTSSIEVGRNYQLITHTILTKFEPVNRCRVTFLRIDITDKILEKARPPINKALAEFDRKIGQFNLRAELDSVWSRLFAPIQVDTLGYILVNPEEVRLSPLHGDGDKIDFTVGLTARPVFSFQPPEVQSPVPLPDISDDTPGSSFIVYMDARLQYGTLSAFLNTALKTAGNVRINKKGYINLADAQVLGTGGRKLLIKVNFNGKVNGTAYKGWIYLTGVPAYNPLTGELSMADLDFTLETKNILVSSGNWMLHSKIQEVLRNKTRWSVQSTLGTLKTGLNNALNQPIGADLNLQGNIDHLDIVGILPMQQYLLLRATANGSVKAEVLR